MPVSLPPARHWKAMSTAKALNAKGIDITHKSSMYLSESVKHKSEIHATEWHLPTAIRTALFLGFDWAKSRHILNFSYITCLLCHYRNRLHQHCFTRVTSSDSTQYNSIDDSICSWYKLLENRVAFYREKQSPIFLLWKRECWRHRHRIIYVVAGWFVILPGRWLQLECDDSFVYAQSENKAEVASLFVKLIRMLNISCRTLCLTCFCSDNYQGVALWN